MQIKNHATLSWIIASALLLLVVSHINSFAADTNGSLLSSKKILILHSYNQSFAWTDQEQAGIMEVLRSEDSNFMPYVEYLDWKRFPDRELVARTRDYLKVKYRGDTIDAVIVSDNLALDFALENRPSLFPRAAISFCGINGYTDAMISGHERVSGVVEDVDPTGTLRLIQTIMPETREIVALIDDSESSRLVRKELEKAIEAYKGKIRLKVLNSLTHDELIRNISDLKSGSVILLGPYYGDREGHTFNSENVVERILPHSQVPVFSLWDFLAGKGITGGSLLSGSLQGRNAALIALRYLRGESSVPVMKEVPTRLLADYRQLERFGLESHPLPAGIELINRPISLLETHFTAVMAVGAVFILMVAIIAALFLSVRRRLQVEAILRASENDLRKSEEKFSKAFHSSPAWMTISTLDQGRYIDVNETFLRECGFTSEEVIGHTSTDLGVWDNDEVRRVVLENIQQGGVIRNREVRRRTKDGRIVTVLWSTVLMELGGEQCLVSASLDITDRKRLEAETIKAQKLESLGVLAGGIAHDFNNLLTGILGNVSLAKQMVQKDENLLERLQSCEKASLRARDLTVQLLTFARGGEPIRTLVLLPQLIRDSASFALRGSNMRCVFNFPQDVWLIEADEGQLSQVINNLVINADQAMPEGGEIIISAANQLVGPQDNLPLKEGNYVRIMVEDHGTGINPAIMPQLFDPYFTTKPGGSGLGLASVYSIVNRHEGYVTVASRPGEGATFLLYLPASTGADGIIPEPVNSDSPVRFSGNVLVMDDEEIIRDVSSEILSHLGFTVTLCSDGMEAVNIYQQAIDAGCRFDLVIMDLTIPGGLGGKDTIKRLAAFDPDITAIVASGYSNDPILANFAFYGFKGAVGKPYRIEELERVIGDVLSGNNDQ